MIGPYLGKNRNETFNKEFLKSKENENEVIEVIEDFKRNGSKKNTKKLKSSINLYKLFTKSMRENEIYKKKKFSTSKTKNLSLYTHFLVHKALQRFKSFSSCGLLNELKEKHFNLLNETFFFHDKKNERKNKQIFSFCINFL